eukprot:jgi/Tetstr1/461357/TSEL_006483.t1
MNQGIHTESPQLWGLDTKRRRPIEGPGNAGAPELSAHDEHERAASQSSAHAARSSQALEGRKAVLLEAHPSTLTSIGNLGAVYQAKGDYAAAEPLYKQALKGRMAALGEAHPDTLDSITCLAIVYHAKVDYAAAESVYKQALEGHRAALREAHPSTLASIYNLGALYQAKGDYAAAEPLYKHAMEGCRAALGEAHPDTLASIYDPGALYHTKGDYAAAEPVFKQALEGRRAALGEAHPSTLTSINNLAILYRAKGDYAAAEPLYKAALEGRRAALGEAHPSTLASISNLAGLYKAKGDYAAAEPLYKQALEGCRAALGEAHPDTLTSINNLAGLYWSKGDYAAAALLYKQALEGRRAALGEAHPHTQIAPVVALHTDTSLAPCTIAGRLAAFSDRHRRQLRHLRLAGRPAVIPCKNEGVSALTSILERRITRPDKGRLPIRIPDLRAMLRRGFSLSSAFDRENHLPWYKCITFLNLGAQAVLFDAELGCRCVRLRVDVDKNVDARHECLAYIPDHVPCLAIRPVDMLEDHLRVFRPPPGGRRLAAPKSSRIGPQNFHTTPTQASTRRSRPPTSARLPRARHLDDSPGPCRQSLRTQVPRAVALGPPLQ